MMIWTQLMTTLPISMRPKSKWLGKGLVSLPNASMIVLSMIMDMPSVVIRPVSLGAFLLRSRRRASRSSR